MNEVKIVDLVGRLGADPETVQAKSGEAMVAISVAENRSMKGADGSYKDKTVWHKVLTKHRVEHWMEFLRKGDLVRVVGEEDIGTYENPQTKETKLTVTIFPLKMWQLTRSKPKEQSSSATSTDPVIDEDIPF